MIASIFFMGHRAQRLEGLGFGFNLLRESRQKKISDPRFPAYFLLANLA
jgi:hypothetical protein